LLIAAALSDAVMPELADAARGLGLDVLVEVHDEAELERALEMQADLIGINNRNLHTFEIDLETTQKLLPFLPQNVVKVSESGIDSLKDMLWLKGLKVDAVLVGSALMRAPSIAGKIKELRLTNE